MPDIKKIIPVKFNDEQKDRLVKLIEDELSEIEKEYSDIELTEKIRIAEENYNQTNPNEQAESEGRPNVRIPIQKLLTKILVSSGVSQTISPDPMILLDVDDEVSTNAMRDRQDKLDFILRKKINYQDYITNDYERAIIYPSSITKVIREDESELYTRMEVYAADDIARFEKDFGQELLNPGSEEFTNWNKLRNGETISIPIEEDKIIYKGACLYNVNLKKFFARPSIKDFRKQIVIAELIDYSWQDIVKRVNNERYGWDKKILDKLKKEYPENYLSQKYNFFECIVQFDKNGDGKIKRYIVTLEGKTKEVVKSIIYTEKQICYVSRSINANDKSWLGESQLPMINGLVDIYNGLYNNFIYQNELAHTPVIATSDPQAGTGKQITLGVINVIPLAQNSQTTQLKFEYTAQDTIQISTYILNMIYLLFGVDPALMSGGETPSDPNAPAAKTAMKLQMTTKRIADMVMSLQSADAKIAEIVDNIEFEYSEEEIDAEMKKTYDVPVRYVVHGSKLTFNKQMEVQLIMQSLQALNLIEPNLLKDLNVKQEIIRNIINSTGGVVEQMRDTIMKPLNNFIEMRDAVKKVKEKMQGVMVEGMQEQPVEEGQGQIQTQQQQGMATVSPEQGGTVA